MKRICFITVVCLFCLGTFSSNDIGQTNISTQFKCEISPEDKGNLELLLDGAITANDEVCVRKILRKGLNPNFLLRNTKGTAPIVIAANNKRAGIIEALLLSGVNVKGEDAETALVVATKIGNLDLVKILLKAGINPNAKSINNNNPLIVSSYRGYADLFTLLLTFGADVNAKTDLGETSLMLASDNSQIVESLLKAGAKLDEVDINNRSAVFYAIENQELTKLEILIKHGANVNLKDKNGFTPLSIAEQIKDLEQKEKIIKLLEGSDTK